MGRNLLPSYWTTHVHAGDCETKWGWFVPITPQIIYIEAVSHTVLENLFMAVLGLSSLVFFRHLILALQLCVMGVHTIHRVPNMHSHLFVWLGQYIYSSMCIQCTFPWKTVWKVCVHTKYVHCPVPRKQWPCTSWGSHIVHAPIMHSSSAKVKVSVLLCIVLVIS